VGSNQNLEGPPNIYVIRMHNQEMSAYIHAEVVKYSLNFS